MWRTLKFELERGEGEEEGQLVRSSPMRDIEMFVRRYCVSVANVSGPSD